MIETECELTGQEFRPSLLSDKIADIQLRNAINPGDLGTLGPYKNKPVPYGSCVVVTPTEIKPEKRIEWIADYIKKHKKIFGDCGATDFHIQITWTGIQGNMEFNVNELEKLADLKVPVNMNYFFNKDE